MFSDSETLGGAGCGTDDPAGGFFQHSPGLRCFFAWCAFALVMNATSTSDEDIWYGLRLSARRRTAYLSAFRGNGRPGCTAKCAPSGTFRGVRW